MPLKTPGNFSFIYGDGSDGDVKVTNEISLSKDMHYNNLILSGSGATIPKINTNSFKIFVRSKLIFVTNGEISCNGLSGSSGVPDGGANGRTVSPIGSGIYLSGTLHTSFGNGGVGVLVNGANAPTVNEVNKRHPFMIGGNGGAGGNTTGGAGGTGGIGLQSVTGLGSATWLFNKHRILKSVYTSIFGSYFISANSASPIDNPNAHITSIGGGCGGGGGRGDTISLKGGGGGGGGGVLLIAANEIIMGVSGTFITASSVPLPGIPFSTGTLTNFSGTIYTQYPFATGTFYACGGDGGIAGHANVAGGGGGGGGAIFLVSSARPHLSGAFGRISGTYITNTPEYRTSSSYGLIQTFTTGGLGRPGGTLDAVNGRDGQTVIYDIE